MGNFTLVNPERLQNLDNITLLACPDIHQSQFYERLVGLQIARTYPDLEVNVVKFPELLAEISQKDLVIYGETVVEPETNKKTCNFSIR